MVVVIKKRITGGAKVEKPLLKPERKKSRYTKMGKYYEMGKDLKKKEKKEKVEARAGQINNKRKEVLKETKTKKGKTIDNLWVEILTETNGRKLTDEKIAVQMSKVATELTGKTRKYLADAVSAHRSGYNCGKFAEQNGVKPKTRLEKYVA